jgi:hypothetical protein
MIKTTQEFLEDLKKQLFEQKKESEERLIA